MINDEKQWIFTISQGVVGNLGVEGDHPPQDVYRPIPAHLSVAVERIGSPQRREEKKRVMSKTLNTHMRTEKRCRSMPELGAVSPPKNTSYKKDSGCIYACGVRNIHASL